MDQYIHVPLDEPHRTWLAESQPGYVQYDEFVVKGVIYRADRDPYESWGVVRNSAERVEKASGESLFHESEINPDFYDLLVPPWNWEAFRRDWLALQPAYESSHTSYWVRSTMVELAERHSWACPECKRPFRKWKYDRRLVGRECSRACEVKAQKRWIRKVKKEQAEKRFLLQAHQALIELRRLTRAR